MVRKIQLCAIIFFLFFGITIKVFAHSIDNIIAANPEFSSAITGISVKDMNGKKYYQLNDNKLLHPASALKFITSSAVLDYLGADYEFKTSIYKKSGNLYLKLSADPLFSYQDMSNLIREYKTKNNSVIKNIYIDDEIIDKQPFGTGWQWDDNVNEHFSQISPYIINKNLFMLKVSISPKNAVFIEYSKEYREPVVNNLSYGASTNISIERNIFQDNIPIKISGTVNKDTIISIPAKHPQILFNNVLTCMLSGYNVPANMSVKYAKTPKLIPIESSVTHSIKEVLKSINQDSYNLAAEILLKHAGYAKTEATGTTKDGLQVVKDYYASNGLKMSDLQIVDGSGASMNDYVTPDFMTDALIAVSKSLNFNIISESMATSSKGTFKGRVSSVNDLKVKTGTLANTSTVIGYIKTKSGKNLVFSIMLDNLPNNVKAKEFENKIIESIYNSL